jgi:hypothetical protein
MGARARGLGPHGRRAMRISISNWATTQDDVDRSAAAILAAYQHQAPLPGLPIALALVVDSDEQGGVGADKRHRTLDRYCPGAIRFRTAARGTDGAAWSSQSSGVRPWLSRASGSAPCSTSTSMVRRKPAFAA